MKRAYLYIVLSGLFLPLATFAADVRVAATPEHVVAGDRVAVTLSVDTRDALNSFSGTLTYDSSYLTPVSVSDGSSVSSIWLKRPKPGATSTPFTGFAAGGFVGKGDLFTVIFIAHKPGTTNITLAGPEFLQNDGQGTMEPVTVRPLTLSIEAASTGSYSEPTDTLPPEPFVPMLGNSTSPFGGAPYIAFAPVDKGSGIDHVEVGETRLPFVSPSFVRAESPYELKDRYLTSRIVVRAYDRTGNVRTSVVPRQYLFRGYELAILGTLIVAFMIWIFLKRRRA